MRFISAIRLGALAGATLFLAATILSGCLLTRDEDEGDRGWWYYCDPYGCYLCNRLGCEFDSPSGSAATAGCAGDWDCGADQRCSAGYCVDGATPSSPSGSTCSMSKDCGSKYACIGGLCVPSRTPCTSHEGCGAGAYCSDLSCKDSGLCQAATDCTAFGTDLVCDNGSCRPGASQPSPSCTNASSCADGLCLNGSCASCAGGCGGATTCQFDIHCGAGRYCLNGHCTGSGTCLPWPPSLRPMAIASRTATAAPACV
jgi:hypothetical protein